MIVFRKLTFRNILSVGNTPVSLDLSEAKTTLVHGTNGSGKSTILDALCYCLFNKPFRRINLPQLVNSQNKKGLLTELEFTIGSTDFKVVRGQKPKVFEVYKNGEQIDNKAADKDTQAYLEQNILKLSYKSFTQVVILGSSNFIPFMQLPSAGRRECVEDFLDIKVFSLMSGLAKERLRGLKDNGRVIVGDIGNLEYKIDLQEQRIKELETKTDSEIKTLQGKIGNAEGFAQELSEELKSLRASEEDILSGIEKLNANNPGAKAEKLNTFIIKFGNKAERLKKNVAFYAENDSCHACNQVITEETKATYTSKAEGELSELQKAVEDATSKLAEYQDALDLIGQAQAELAKVQREAFEKDTELKGYLTSIKGWEDAITDIQMSGGSIDKEQGKLELMNEDLANLKGRKNDNDERIKEHDVVVRLLKDSGIKTQIVNKYLPVMNKCIRKYLGELDMPIHFTLDSEFNESVSSPLHQDFSYASFSEGQKARIDLSLMLTWREIGKLKNSVSTNILFLDEVFSGSLDEVGKEYLLHILRHQLENTNVVVVDHTLSGNFRDKFDKQVEVTRIGGFSRYK